MTAAVVSAGAMGQRKLYANPDAEGAVGLLSP